MAMMMTNSGTRIFGMITGRSSDAETLESTWTTNTATPSMTPFLTVVVTATAGQRLSARRNTGFSSNSPLISRVPIGGEVRVVAVLTGDPPRGPCACGSCAKRA
jgi:hypothetical protein